MKIVNIIGARPQFIKMAALNRALKNNKNIHSVIIHTGQHYDFNMSEIFFQEMDVPFPEYNLGINQLGRELTIVKMASAIKNILINESPDMVIVFGDTNSTLGGAIAAHEADVPVAHIEAGLRSHNICMPEELNRIETDKLSFLLFAPTIVAFNNLQQEKLFNRCSKIILSGDIMLDSYNYYSKMLEQSNVSFKNLPGRFILCSLHRQYLIENPGLFAQVIEALNKLNEKCPVVMTAHPRTFKALQNISIVSNFKIIEPQGYHAMLHLLKHCNMVITDSGGLQKEAYFSKKYCITIRDETEWQELVDLGVNITTGYTYENIISAYDELNCRNSIFDQNFYGDGNSAQIILDELLNHTN